MSKRLLDNHSRIFHAARTCERFDNTDKKVGRNCQIMSGAGCRTKRFLQAIKGRRLLIITTDVVKQIQKLGQAGFIDISALLTHAIAGPFFQMLIGSPSLGYTDHRYVQVTTLDYVIKSGKDLLVSESPIAPNRTRTSVGRASSGGSLPVQAFLRSGIGFPGLRTVATCD